VRQNIIRYLNEEKKFPLSLMALESGFKLNKRQKRTDVMVFDRNGKSLAIVECKAPPVALTSAVFDQILRYNLIYNVPFLIITNGLQHYCCKLDYKMNRHEFLKEIPEYGLISGVD
jgi:type I site-specific restriction endonuclease